MLVHEEPYLTVRGRGTAPLGCPIDDDLIAGRIVAQPRQVGRRRECYVATHGTLASGIRGTNVPAAIGLLLFGLGHHQVGAQQCAGIVPCEEHETVETVSHAIVVGTGLMRNDICVGVYVSRLQGSVGIVPRDRLGALFVIEKRGVYREWLSKVGMQSHGKGLGAKGERSGFGQDDGGFDADFVDRFRRQLQ